MTGRQLVQIIEDKLKKNNVESAAFEARVMVETACGLSPGAPLPLETDSTGEAAALAMADRRITGYPLQYMVGHWPFMGLEFSVGEGVLIPRQDTELLCETAMEQIGDREAVVIDLCSGTGCIGISVAHYCKNARIYAVEKEEIPYACTLHNGESNGVALHCIRGDVLKTETRALLPMADMILSNPPYLTREDMQQLQREVTFEPAAALYGGADGLLFYRQIPSLWRERLKKGGTLLLEVGAGQAPMVEKFLLDAGYEDVGSLEDLCGIARVVRGRRPL